MTDPPPPAPDEWERDEMETEFTELLRVLRQDIPAVTAALFVDDEGESIDYVSVIEPYEAKVLGAHMLNLQRQLENLDPGKVGAGTHIGMEVICGEGEMWVRRISDDYSLVLRTAGQFERAHLRTMVVRTCVAFRALAGLESPEWEPPVVPVDVKVREAVGWDYAPVSFREHGERVAVADVLGRWTEASEDAAGVCFRVRTEEGRELTLIHLHATDAWLIR